MLNSWQKYHSVILPATISEKGWQEYNREEREKIEQDRFEFRVVIFRKCNFDKNKSYQSFLHFALDVTR